MKVAVLGSGAGALAVAADMSRHGRATVMADFDDLRADLEPVADTGGVTVSDDGRGEIHCPVTVAASIPEALDGAELAVVAVPCSAHERWAQAVAPHTTADQTVLFVGEASGAIVARRAIEPPTIVAEANTLPCLARRRGPGAVGTVRKQGGVLIAALPCTPSDTARVMDLIGGAWPYATATDTVWTTVLASYDAIDRAAAMVANADALGETVVGMPPGADSPASMPLGAHSPASMPLGADSPASMPLGALGAEGAEGAAPTVLNVIEAADAELLALRRAFFSKEPRRYQDFLVAQGLAPDLGGDAALGDTVRAGRPVAGFGPIPAAGGLNTGCINEDVPCALVLASSLGEAAGVPTPVIDGLVAVASAMAGQDSRDEGRTLAALGLGGLDVTGLVGFARSGMFP